MQYVPALHESRQALIAHPLVPALRTASAWRTFMEHHVFAVWDFMSLLKRLQQELTCTELPWRPRPAGRFTRLVNEIVLAEESDEDGAGGHCSHFELYRRAMAAAGADTRRIDAFLHALAGGAEVGEALTRAEAPASAAAHVLHTLAVAQRGSLEAVCAAFLWGREDLIPDLFSSLVPALEGHDRAIGPLRYYMERHIELDGGSHGALAAELLDFVCDGDAARRAHAETEAVQCLRVRHGLWTGILAAL